MNAELFKQQIEDSIKLAKNFDEKIMIKGTIARTLRLALKYPEQAKEYQNTLNKAVCE